MYIISQRKNWILQSLQGLQRHRQTLPVTAMPLLSIANNRGLPYAEHRWEEEILVNLIHATESTPKNRSQT